MGLAQSCTDSKKPLPGLCAQGGKQAVWKLIESRSWKPAGRSDVRVRVVVKLLLKRKLPSPLDHRLVSSFASFVLTLSIAVHYRGVTYTSCVY